jgi:16S rRNA (cytidine1402-2'-O)-methyltransferase
MDTLQVMQECFGANRQIAVAKELTKLHEFIRVATATEQVQYFSEHADVLKGEFVLLVEGVAPVATSAHDIETDKMLSVLLDELPLKQAVKIAAQLTGERKNVLYEKALVKKGGNDE